MTALTLFVERSPTPVGDMLILTDDHGRLRCVDWADCEPRMLQLLRQQYGKAPCVLQDRTARSPARSRLDAYIAGELGAIDDLEVATGGTPFQREVWAELRRIPLGQTISYSELARRIGRPNAVRAVGLANGANPVSIVIPCHRVIGADASLTGYGGGLHRKVWLLEHEGVRLASRNASRQAALF
ncbi:MAG: methylated-DNA--[protein]-cysteine S-methyltransferase [Pigmentiphaga sp.]|uniref:methylated-DNA--[protein]-cysteine S-methyltransferase n=1 Tax=Pigmentiphaga sp. TaxID=1977564 RepID=UPI0029AB6974|nr:methylated-DNA--[protein]-cysteine S-methyltransferase [Pigmentiphaga sp.]MDX3907527.1 methylated-DNA--[protein]-cysteine S-methyltransferase [Pigmentiphaga sp.]